MLWISAFLLGFAGSLHCGIMCGPIVLATQGQATRASIFLLRQIAYNSGRILTYALIGATIGLVGKGLQLAGLQQSLSILTGLIIFGMYFVPIIFERFKASNSYLSFISKILRQKLGPLLRSQSIPSKFLLGLVNGFLPCGLVYVATAAALGTGSLSGAILFMVIFGLGTVPMLVGVSLFRTFITRLRGLKPTRIIPFFVATISILFVLRGLNLDIPYISPLLMGEDKQEMTICR